MTPSEFVVWLKGFLQGSTRNDLSPEQLKILKDVLNKVKLDKSPSVNFLTD